MNLRKSFSQALFMGAVLLALATVPAAAQGETLRLSLTRTWGYSMGGDIQGSFLLTASGPQDLQAVKFYVDDQLLGEATQAPFRMALQTGNYTPGTHTLRATGQTSGGQTMAGNAITVNVLSSGQGAQAAGRIVVPLLIVVLLAVVLGAGGSAWLSSRRGSSGQPPVYGPAGGVICPKCGRPFALTLLAPNVVTGKLVRCPYCGKWSVARRASREALAAAEAAEAAASQPTVREMSAEDKLRRQIEDSRYR